MLKEEEEVSESVFVAWILATTSALVLVYLLNSSLFRRYCLITDAEWFFCIGVVLKYCGFAVWSSFSDHNKMHLLSEVARYTIAFQLISSALSLPKSWFMNNMRSILWLVIFVLPFSWILTWCFGLAVFASHGHILINPRILLMVAAATAPTDPVLSSSIVKGKLAERFIPQEVRFMIIAESGINDGAGYPIVLAAVYIYLNGAFTHWLWSVVIVNTIVAMLIGALLGFVFAEGVTLSSEREWIDKESVWAIIVPFAILVVAVINSYGGNGILGLFIAGLLVNYYDIDYLKRIEQQVTSTLDIIATATFFIFLGSIFPWDAVEYQLYLSRLIGWALLLLILRRLPFVFLVVWAKGLESFKEDGRLWLNTMMLACYGPVAVAGALYASEIYIATEDISVFNVMSLIILVSLILHGSSSIICTRLMNS